MSEKDILPWSRLQFLFTFVLCVHVCVHVHAHGDVCTRVKVCVCACVHVHISFAVFICPLDKCLLRLYHMLGTGLKPGHSGVYGNHCCSQETW